MASGSLKGIPTPGNFKVVLMSGVSKHSNNDNVIVCLGTRNPNVLRLGCNISLGTRCVAFKINVYAPGVNALSKRKIGFVIRAYRPKSDKLPHTRVIL